MRGIRLLYIFLHTCCLVMSLFSFQIASPHFLHNSGFRWLQALLNLGLILCWLGIFCYNGQFNQKIQIVFYNFSWAASLMILVEPLLYKTSSLFIAHTTFAFLVVLGGTSTSSLTSVRIWYTVGMPLEHRYWGFIMKYRMVKKNKKKMICGILK